ncbi:DBH-like monooxygenase protein 1 [Mactra antiquata]
MDKPMTMYILLIISSLVAMVTSQDTLPDRSRIVRYPYTEDLDMEGRYILRWNFNETHAWFEVQVNTTGYVGFGISTEGRMRDSDIFVAYVANDRVYSGDFYTRTGRYPLTDDVDDWIVDYGYEQGGWTVIGFTRLLDTCDTQDKPITEHTTRLIYAYGYSDPSSLQALRRHDERGSKGVNLLTRPTRPMFLPADSQTADFRNENYTIPSTERSTFRCRVFDLTNVLDKYHIIKISPVFTPETEYHVGHMTLFRCHVPAEDLRFYAGQDFNCFTDAPGHVQFCREHVASFGNGKTDFYLPEDIGIPIGGGGNEPNMYVLAMQYTNQDKTPGLVDSSGIRITYTSELRQHEAGFMTVGNIISPNWAQFIPPGETDFLQKAYCSMKCLAWGMEGCVANGTVNPTVASPFMTVAGVQFLSHELGKTMKLRHLAYDEKHVALENPWLAYDNSYDPNEQTFRVLPRRQNITCWDELLLECVYNSQNRMTPTVGGWTALNELCRAHVLYYPRKRIEGCMSWSSYQQLQDRVGNRIEARHVFKTLHDTDWHSPASNSMRNNLKRALRESSEIAQCWSSRRERSYAVDGFPQPTIIGPYTEPVTSTCV